jgi:peptidoglycan-N-acetylglucosamine deacetylase
VNVTRRGLAAGTGALVLVVALMIGVGGTASASRSATACPASPGASAVAAELSRHAGPEQLFQIQSAALCQDGQQLSLRIALAHPFSASALAREQRSLCLLIERVATSAVWGEVCVIGPARHSHHPRLAYRPVSGTTVGRQQVIAADVTLRSHSELSATFLPAAVDLRYGPIRWQVASTLSAARCGSPQCSVLAPATPTLLRLHTPVLTGCVASGPSEVFQGPANQREIALTFDDGPWNDPPTADFLSMLEREHVPATFFEIGDQLGTYDRTGALQRRMLADGDMIGDHTWTHPIMTSLRKSAQRAELAQTIDAIRHDTGFTPCLWRPPYGAVNGPLLSLARSLGLLTIMWDVDPSDWKLPGVGAIYSNVIDHAHNGAIVIQHFGGGPRYQTLAAVPKEISTLRARGYRFVTVAQLLGLQLVYR